MPHYTVNAVNSIAVKAEADRQYQQIRARIAVIERRLFALDLTHDDVRRYGYARRSYVPREERVRAAEYVLGYTLSDRLRSFYEDFAETARKKPEDWGGPDDIGIGGSVCTVMKEGGFDWGEDRLERW